MKSKILIALLLLLTVTYSCDDFLDVNDDPDAPSTVALDLRLEPMIRLSNGAAMWRGTREIAAVMQYVGGINSGNAADCWKFTSANFVWQNTLVWTYPNAVDLIVMGEDQNSPHFSGAGRVFKVFLLLMLTDQHGEIPYDDLYDGRSPVKLEPRFEKQQDVYVKLLDELDMAIAEFNQTENEIPLDRRGGDVIYQGDIKKWTKFAYALKARILNHYSKKPSEYNPQAIIDACANAFDGDGQDAEFEYSDGGSSTQANPWSDEGYGDLGLKYGGYSSFYIDILKASPLANDAIDPRLALITTASEADGEYRGVVVGRGLDDGMDETNYSPIQGGFFTSGASPWPFITYAEVKFIEAEAKLRNNDVAGSRAAFAEGVLANMRKMEVDPALMATAEAKIDAMTDADFTPLNAGLHYIMTQKYIALTLNPETWADMRRMDYSSDIYHGLIQPENVNTIFGPTEWMRAMVYEYNEENRNPDNIPDNTPEVRLKTPVWWDIAE